MHTVDLSAGVRLASDSLGLDTTLVVSLLAPEACSSVTVMSDVSASMVLTEVEDGTYDAMPPTRRESVATQKAALAGLLHDQVTA